MNNIGKIPMPSELNMRGITDAEINNGSEVNIVENTTPAEDVNPLIIENNNPPVVDNTASVDDLDIPDDKLFSSLSKKMGREIKSMDDLSQKEKIEVEKIVEKEVYKYKSPEAEAYDKYFEETGRSINDFSKLNRDWSKADSRESVLAYLKDENPYLDDEDIRFKLDEVYKIPEKLDPEMEEPADVIRRNREIKMAEIEWKELVAKANKYHESNKSKYITPLEDKKKQYDAMISESNDSWSKSILLAKDSVGRVKTDNFEYEVKDKSIVDKLTTPDKVVDIFKGEDGKFSHKDFLNSVLIGKNINDILVENEKQVRAKVMAEQMNMKTNPSDSPIVDAPANSKDKELEDVKNIFLNNHRSFR